MKILPVLLGLNILILSACGSQKPPNAIESSISSPQKSVLKAQSITSTYTSIPLAGAISSQTTEILYNDFSTYSGELLRNMLNQIGINSIYGAFDLQNARQEVKPYRSPWGMIVPPSTTQIDAYLPLASDPTIMFKVSMVWSSPDSVTPISAIITADAIRIANISGVTKTSYWSGRGERISTWVTTTNANIAQTLLGAQGLNAVGNSYLLSEDIAVPTSQVPAIKTMKPASLTAQALHITPICDADQVIIRYSDNSAYCSAKLKPPKPSRPDCTSQQYAAQSASITYRGALGVVTGATAGVFAPPPLDLVGGGILFGAMMNADARGIDLKAAEYELNRCLSGR